MNKTQKIAIIGAGLSGLTAAHTLKKSGYSNITIFEAEDRVGGKIWSTKIDGLIYELGAIVLLSGSKTVENLAKEYNVSITKESKKGLIYSNGKQVSQLKYMTRYNGLFKISISVLIFFYLLLKNQRFKSPGFFNVGPELYVNLKKYFEDNGLKPFLPVTETMLQTYCYGYPHITPTLYLMKLFRGGIDMFFKEQINNSLGLNLYTIRSFKNGYQYLLKEIAKNFDVRLNSKITNVKRERDKESFKIHISTNGKTEIYDRVIISSLPIHTMKFLDMNEDEKEIFSRVKYYNYHEIMFYGDVPLKASALLFGTDYHTNNKGFPGGIAKLHHEKNIYQSYQTNDGTIPDEELEKKVRDSVDMIGGKIDEIILTKTFTYFPHFIENDLKKLKPYDRLEKMQGENCTYFIGSLLNTEGTEQTAEYAQYLMNKHF